MYVSHKRKFNYIFHAIELPQRLIEKTNFQ